MSNERRSDEHSRPGTTVQGEPDAAASAQTIGNYRLLERIGEGSMGEVWAAKQTAPVRREVALKIIKRGMDSDEVVTRFEAERQALALMNHPNVAKVFDAGTTPGGRPYFAMERVHGEPISDYCDRHRLDTRARLELFTQVCDGVQHAHQKGVIHRDLKPSNILVTLEDGKHPRPKIIDFGIAKATNQRLTERTLYTELGRLIGTPEYMSPEQAEMTGLDIDTRTDVYSLGVVLYVMVSGVLPFDSQSLRTSGLFELQRKIRDEDPPRPSTRVSRLGSETGSIAQNHAMAPDQLVRRLRGDLDLITMKAMEKDRTRRYDSAADLAADVRRHLANEPIEAGSPSAFYRTRKFVRRHVVGVAAAVALLVALLAGIAGTTTGLLRARAAEAQAIEARDEAVAERDRAERARTETEEVVAFLTGLFKKSDPYESLGEAMTAREILDRGANEIETGFADRPLIRARLLQALGGIYTRLGDLDRGLDQLGEALSIQRAELGNDHPDTIAAIVALADAAGYSSDYERSRRLAREAVALATARWGERHALVIEALSHVGRTAEMLSSLDEARAVQLRALDIARSMPDLDDATLEKIVRRTAFVVDDPVLAEKLYLESIDLSRRVNGERHPQTIFALDNFAIFLHNEQRFDDAEPIYRQALEMLIEIYGREHPEVAQTMGNVGTFLADRMISTGTVDPGTLAESEALLSESLRMDRMWRPDHSYLANNLCNLAHLYQFAGRHADVEPLIAEALEVYARSLPPDHPAPADAQALLGRSLLAQGRHDEAEVALRRAHPKLVGQEDYEEALRETLEDLVKVYEVLGRPADAATVRAELAALPEAS